MIASGHVTIRNFERNNGQFGERLSCYRWRHLLANGGGSVSHQRYATNVLAPSRILFVRDPMRLVRLQSSGTGVMFHRAEGEREGGEFSEENANVYILICWI